MTRSVWRIATKTPRYTATDLSGNGAKFTGGRWNSVGTAILYTASNIPLAVLETVVHLSTPGLPLNKYLVRIDIPDNVWANAWRPIPPNGWDNMPADSASMRFGDNWVSSGASALLAVPSVIVPEEFNILINPAHPDTARITATEVRLWTYDSRLL